MTTPLRYPDLAAALRHVQQSPHDGRAVRHWEVIVTAISRAARQLRLHDRVGEVISATFLRVRETSAVFTGTSEGEAYRYIQRLAKTAFFDELRKDRRHDKRKQLRSVYDERDPLESVAAPEPEPSAQRTPEEERRRLADFKDRLHGRIDVYIEQLPQRSAAQTELRWNEAMSALSTVIDKKGAKDIARELGVPERFTARIHKWKERGQALVLAVLDSWAAEAEPEDQEAITCLRELFSERRADAGVARPQRRKGSKSAGQPPSQGGAVSSREPYASVQHAGRGSKRPDVHRDVHRGVHRARREVPSV